jgi:hypothetical protein
MHPVAALIDRAYLSAFVAHRGRLPARKGIAVVLSSTTALLV